LVILADHKLLHCS